MRSQRGRLLICALAVGALGYWLRLDAPIHEWLRDASAGAAYVIFWILLCAFVNPKARAGPISMVVFCTTCALEFLQLWHPRWLEIIRGTLPGRLVLGTTFEWRDFPPYGIGAAIGWGVVRIVLREGYIRLR